MAALARLVLVGPPRGLLVTGVYYFDFPGERGLPDGTQVCGRFFVNNGSQVGALPATRSRPEA